MNKAAIFCGSRGLDDQAAADAIMGTWVAGGGERVVITGGAGGADSLFHLAASAFPGIQAQVIPAQWSAHGRSAGHIRNRRMLDLLLGMRDRGYQVEVVALIGDVITPGTAGMTSIARIAGITVTVHRLAHPPVSQGALI